ncbi:MAG: HAMP domain-containing histidine kinase [Caulobacteraceae bacterium]|nr:HAMP domain-containing histidine kinase [Caulobacteraceae bacterium]
MIRDSLRLRLLAAAAVAIFAALGLAGAGMSWFYVRHIEQREADALIRDGKLLAGGLRLDPAGRPAADARPGDDRYGEAASGLYWQLTTSKGGVRSDSLWDQSLSTTPGAERERWRIRHAPGPFGKSLLMAERPITPEHASEPVLVQVATDDAYLHAARREFNREIALSLGLLWLFLLIAAHLQVSLGLRPLAAVRRQIGALRGDPAARLPAGHPREIAPLADAINALADAREADLGRARKRAGDLAHSLKTPLAALAAQSRRAREQGALEAADGLDRALAAMRATLEAELARTRAAAAREAGRSFAADIETLIENVIAVIERTELGERLIFEVDIPDDVAVPVAGEDLTELLGALVENAARHARHRVRIRGGMAAGESRLWIEDDGPGLGRESSQAVMARGARLDEAGPGHGLGLAIVGDLMQATGGAIALDRSGLGGLEACLTWPVGQLAPQPRAPGVVSWRTRR